MTARRFSAAPTRARRSSRLRAEALEARDVPSFVTGTVFNDLNDNGIQDPNESGLAGWNVFSDNDRNGVLEPGGASAQTDANGTYVLDTTNVTPFYSSTGAPYQYAALDLPAGTGGRWLNTTQLEGYTPDGPASPGPDFGAVFHSDAQAGFAAVGAEQLVNVVTDGLQGSLDAMSGGNPGSQVSVAADAVGNYVVAWRTAVANVSDQVFARVFNADGTPRTGDLLVSTEPPPVATQYSWQLNELPRVAMADDGRFVVGWASANGAKVRVYNAGGAPVTGPVVVAATSSNTSIHFAGVADDATGNFAVAYTKTTKSKWGWGTPNVLAQRFTAAGVASGGPISVANLTLVNGLQSIAMSDTGSFVVVYDDATSTSGGVYAQRYSASGKKAGGVITVADGDWPSNVAMNGSGQFVVSSFNSSTGTHVRVYSADGTAAGPVVQPGNAGQNQVGLVIDEGGNVTMAWTDAHGGSAYRGAGEVRVCRLQAGATAPLAQTLANAVTQGTQTSPGLAALPNGGFVAAFQGYGPGDDAGIFAQRFASVSGGASAVLTSIAAPSPAGAVDLTGLEWFGADGKKDRL